MPSSRPTDPRPPQTVLGFDFGLKNIGVAVGQSVTHTATALTTLKAKDGIPKWPEIEQLIAKWRPHALIVGIPLQMDDAEQLMTFCARKFCNRLRQKYQLPVHEIDERLSSWEAKTRVNNLRLRKIKSENETHAISAVVLIEQWMTENF
jgi:putative Holliday junction resolvase